MEDKMEGTSWEELGISNDFYLARLCRIRNCVRGCSKGYFRIWR